MKSICALLIGLIGLSVHANYDLVETSPRCYVTLGPSYCPKISATWTNDYMSWIERTHQVLVNSMRINPVAFATSFTNNTIIYACAVNNTYPFRYNANAQQAAKQQSFFLNVTGCPFSHNTCPSYCHLYSNSCSFSNRIGTYETNWANLGENIVMTYMSQINNPMAPLLQWAKSSGHCRNMFSPNFKNIGVGAIGRYWTHVFTSLWKEAVIANPLYDGTHWRGSPLFGTNDLYFIANYHYPTAPNNITVRLNNQTERMLTRYTGTRERGTYIFRLQNYTLPSCLRYVFRVHINNTVYQLPETGYFMTIGINNCTLNYKVS